MRKLLISLFCLVSMAAQAQADCMLKQESSISDIWNDGSQWDVYYTVESDGTTDEDSVRVTFCLRTADNGYLALEKTVTINHVKEDTQLQGYIRNGHDSIIYVRPVLDDGSIGPECLLYDFSHPYEYGNTVKYGVMSGFGKYAFSDYEIKEAYIDWHEDSLDYYMLNNGDTHCLPAWNGIVYRYGYIGGPMELFLQQAVPGKSQHPKPTNISHVIFSTKGGHKTKRVKGGGDEQEVVVPYDEMLTLGTTWECLAVSTEQPDQKYIYNIQVVGDTLIGSRLCKQIYAPKHHIRMTLFEEGRKVYIINAEEKPEVLLDFGLQVGDRFNDVESALSIDSQNNLGYSYRTITIDTSLDCQSYFTGDTSPWIYYLIEGIGVSKDQHLSKLSFVNDRKTISFLLRCWKDGSLVYQAPRYESVAGISEICTNNHQPLYDLQGRRLNNVPRKGIYIDGSKKMVCK